MHSRQVGLNKPLPIFVIFKVQGTWPLSASCKKDSSDFGFDISKPFFYVSSVWICVISDDLWSVHPAGHLSILHGKNIKQYTLSMISFIPATLIGMIAF